MSTSHDSDRRRNVFAPLRVHFFYYQSVRRREEPSNVRPLSPGDALESHIPARPRPRIWLGPAAASFVLLLVLVVFSAGGDEGAPPTTANRGMVGADATHLTTTTTILPPRLEEILPVETEHLVAISRSGDPRTVLWSPSDQFARSYRLAVNPRSASFDATGAYVALLDTRSTLHAGPLPGDAARAVADAVSAARFHPTTAGELAYTASPVDAGTTGLYRTTAAPGLLGGIDSELVAQIPPDGRLLTWGDWGYAIFLTRFEAVLILDPAGRPERVMSGVAHAAGGDAILIEGHPAGIEKNVEMAALAPEVVVPVPEVGIVDRLFQPIFLFPGVDTDALNVTISHDGLRLAQATFTNTGGTSVTIRDRSESTLRNLRLDSVAVPISFVADGEYLAMQDAETGELVFVDWRTGARHRVAGLSGDFVAVDL